jgi:hypothetical protein
VSERLRAIVEPWPAPSGAARAFFDAPSRR